MKETFRKIFVSVLKLRDNIQMYGNKIKYGGESSIKIWMK